MKKETFTEKLIKRTYGISGPLDEYKRREPDRIGNQVFIILFYLMIFGNLYNHSKEDRLEDTWKNIFKSEKWLKIILTLT